MTDPLTDPRALNLLAAQPDAVDALGQRCTLLACQAHDTSSGVRGAAGAAQWTGDAADTFRRWATKLPGQLDQMYSAYSAASDAPDTYGINLVELKQRIQTLVGELTSARSALGTAQSAMADAQQTLTQASIQQVIVGGLPGPGAGSQAPSPTRRMRPTPPAGQSIVLRGRSTRSSSRRYGCSMSSTPSAARPRTD